MVGDWNEIALSAIVDVKHGFAFPGENIREEAIGDILLTPGNFAIGGGFKGDKYNSTPLISSCEFPFRFQRLF